MAARYDADTAAHHLGDVLRLRALQFAEQQPAPQQPDQRVGVPQRKGRGQADVANGEDGQRVGDCPQRAGEDRPDDQVLSCKQIGEDIAGSLEQRRERPARGEHAGDHAERNGEGREARVDQLGGRLGRAQPDARGQAADHAQPVQRSAGVVPELLPRRCRLMSSDYWL